MRGHFKKTHINLRKTHTKPITVLLMRGFIALNSLFWGSKTLMIDKKSVSRLNSRIGQLFI